MVSLNAIKPPSQGIYEMNIFFVVMYSAYGLLLIVVVKKFVDNNVRPLTENNRLI